jgi:hypothetical protein
MPDSMSSEINEKVIILENELKHNNKMTAEILRIVKGDNGTGLVTKVALNTSAIGRIWWWLGGISLCILGVVIKAYLF